MASVSIVKLLNNKILLFVSLLLVSIFLSFLWVTINQIRITIKMREWGEDRVQINIEEVESDDKKEIKSDKPHSNQISIIELQ